MRKILAAAVAVGLTMHVAAAQTVAPSVVPPTVAPPTAAPQTAVSQVGSIQTPAAQTPAAQTPTRVRGSVTQLSGDMLEVRDRTGQTVQVRLTNPVTVLAVIAAAEADLMPGSSVGVASVPGEDGSARALEVTVLPPGARNNPLDGPWDLTPTSRMTNGTVGSLVMAAGRTITVNYGSGERKIAVPDDVPVVTFGPGDRALLVPGAAVVVFARPAEDGSLSASAVAVGRGGVVPPM